MTVRADQTPALPAITRRAVYQDLVALERAGSPIRVAVMGAGGSMGRGLALQCARTPGVRMVAAIDIDTCGAEQAAELQERPWTTARSGAEVRAAVRTGKTIVSTDATTVLAEGREAVDVFIESTSSVAAAARAIDAALQMKIDVVLMNAEVDCLLGPSLHRAARESGAV